MKLANHDARLQNGRRKIVSKTDALVLMIASVAVALFTTGMTVSGLIGYTRGPVALALPVATAHHAATGLTQGATGHFTTLEASIPELPSGPATLLAWADSLNQMGFLAVLALVFLLAHRLRSEILFTPASAWIVASCGAILALCGTVGQVLDSSARSRLAEMIGVNARTPGESHIFWAHFNVAPFVVGIVLVLVAGVFQFGRGLQKDTEGLV
ncbi:energy-converting hydrogenase Eha subunit E [Arthrobacter ginsengisoli]|uniref:Energy-converting hydrogenase Eha subunit E n=1 Tax=Arthrobacter ginsengisoli TaxID=1356565 RepID=A0ABU1UHE5_9MICC|nr:hypothetical protein [Arthrobacter ginsengisoli]MDR7084619.1 energy-converting hydrogenase Eha subunit E [Arthrobacter ginsengisoli]